MVDTTNADATAKTPRLSDRMASQSALLFVGLGGSQVLSFVRNALIGHALSKGDFGIAASITLMLQLVEQISDLGADRLIVQARDGATPRFIAAAHTLLVARGLLLAAVLFATGPAIAHYFNVPFAAAAFQIAALQPLARGFLHLDYRAAQRQLDNRPQLLVEVMPQLVSVILVLPMLYALPDYSAVAYLAVAQGVSAVVTSHVLAKSPYRLAFDANLLSRQFAFGWPILLSAIPLLAVYHGDRMIIARLFGMESLAAYTAAFMITMVPGLIAAKVGHALMLPLFADTLARGRSLSRPLTAMTEAVVVTAACYLAIFCAAGHTILPLAFGPHYVNLGPLVATLAVMWAIRMIQAVPGMALMAHGETKPFAVAGLVRGAALPVVLFAAMHGASLVTLAGIGCIFEAASLVYVAWRLEALDRGYGRLLLKRSLFLLPVASAALALSGLLDPSPLASLSLGFAMSGCAIGAAMAMMPTLRRGLEPIAQRLLRTAA